jgi:hypothetical protein
VANNTTNGLTVTDPNNITLNLDFHYNGGGRAYFGSSGTNSHTTLTGGASVIINGQNVSSTADDITITVKDQFDHQLAAINLSVVWVTLSVNASAGQHVTPGDTASNAYADATSQSRTNPSIGPIIIPSGLNSGCGIGVEVVGRVTPSNYAGQVFLLRWIMHERTYDDGNQIESFEAASLTDPNAFDTRVPALLATNPQAAAPLGQVYALDAAGPLPPAVGVIRSGRQTFRVFAVLDSINNRVPASAPIEWYARSSCTTMPNGTYSFNPGISGDNQGGQGCTSVNRDLSGNCPQDPLN